MGDVLDAGMRMLVRHQWVRDHGTPRVTALVGATTAGRALWDDWRTLSGRAAGDAVAPPRGADLTWLDAAATELIARAAESPTTPVALAVDAALFRRWRAARDDRRAALLDEGVVPVARAVARRRAAPSTSLRARSLAELTLFEALEATPATAGRFVLNDLLSVRFGNRAAEVDLLSRGDAIAIEVDGYHHFQDVEHYRRDRAKDRVLQLHGYTVLRFLAEDVLADARPALEAVKQVLAARLRAAPGRKRP